MGPSDGVFAERQLGLDYVKLMKALVASHPTLTWQVLPGGIHLATWNDDDGAQSESREDLSDLYNYVKAKLGR